MPISRTAEATVIELARGYPVVAVTGPRQSGKTTLARRCFPDHPYVSLEDLTERDFATDDPRGFLQRFPDGAVLDEVQRSPDLLSYLQTTVDRLGRTGAFVLTGSQQLGLLAGITQSLAGRVGLVTLLPFSRDELRAAGWAPPTIPEALYRGGFPPVYDRPVEPSSWYANYTATYIERDVRQMVNVRDLVTFRRFVRMCAARTGQLVNLSSLASDCGVTYHTARAWVSVLEAGFLVHLLPPYHRNFNKRLVRTPKLYFTDAGLAASLLGIHETRQVENHPLYGALFETWVVTELLKARFNRGLASNLSFWRDRSGHEVDVIAEDGATLRPVEIKAGRTVNRDYFKGLAYFRSLTSGDVTSPRLVYGGDERHRRDDCEVVPWSEVADVIV